MKILGVDFGTKKIGLAIADHDLVEPWGIIPISNFQFPISKICQEEKIEKIVVGVSEGKSAQRAKKFGQKLNQLLGLPVEFTDETLTTHDALAKMKTVGKKWKDKPDAIAAALILNNYLEKNV